MAADWTANAIMSWNGNMITDHGRQSLSESVERIGTDKRMADGTLRRQFIGLKRTWQAQWDNLPSTNRIATGYKTADGNWSGEQIESFYRTTSGVFRLVLRRGSAKGKAVPAGASTPGVPYSDNDFYAVDVMFTDFSKETVKRGTVDLWNMSVTMEEV